MHERLEMRGADAPGNLREWASIENSLRDEYAGRFLIELLQNARDAQTASYPTSVNGVVYVHLTSEPALVVANQGIAVTPEVVLEAIGKVGQTTKPGSTDEPRLSDPVEGCKGDWAD